MFYPLDREVLVTEVRGHVEVADPPAFDFPLRGLIVPHAGYMYSGPTAGFAYQLLLGSSFTSAVMLGPSHYVAFRGLALPGVAAMATPLADFEVDQVIAEKLLDSPLVLESEQAHGREHSLEVQLPFLHHVLPRISVVPLLTGDVDPAAAASLLDGVLSD